MAAEQAKTKAAQMEVELYVALLNDAEKTAGANGDMRCLLLYDAETEIGTLKAVVGERKENVALKAPPPGKEPCRWKPHGKVP